MMRTYVCIHHVTEPREKDITNTISSFTYTFKMEYRKNILLKWYYSEIRRSHLTVQFGLHVSDCLLQFREKTSGW